MHNYSEEQIKDIEEREKKAFAYLKELELTPAATSHSVNIGSDVFAMKITPYLNDTKYAPKPAETTKEN